LYSADAGFSESGSFILTKSSTAKRPCDCCVGQFWPKYDWNSSAWNLI